MGGSASSSLFKASIFQQHLNPGHALRNPQCALSRSVSFFILSTSALFYSDHLCSSVSRRPASSPVVLNAPISSTTSPLLFRRLFLRLLKACSKPASQPQHCSPRCVNFAQPPLFHGCSILSSFHDPPQLLSSSFWFHCADGRVHAAHHTKRHPGRLDHKQLSASKSKRRRLASAAFSCPGPEPLCR